LEIRFGYHCLTRLVKISSQSEKTGLGRYRKLTGVMLVVAEIVGQFGIIENFVLPRRYRFRI
jgi:hypothetical protein